MFEIAVTVIGGVVLLGITAGIRAAWRKFRDRPKRSVYEDRGVTVLGDGDDLAGR